MAKLPYMQFYVDDWLSDEKLRACSSAAIGLWIDLICLMHKNDRRGYLQLNEKPATPLQIARMTGRHVDSVSVQLTELLEAGVPSVDERGVLYSRRIVRDEQIRMARSEAGSRGGKASAAAREFAQANGQANGQAKRKQNPGSDSGSNSLLNTGEDGGAGEGRFDRFWKAYPRKTSKDAARRAWSKLKPDAALLDRMLAAIVEQSRSKQWQEGVIPHPATWLNGRRWEDEVTILGGKPPAIAKTPTQIAAETLAHREKAKAVDEAARATVPPGFSIRGPKEAGK